MLVKHEGEVTPFVAHLAQHLIEPSRLGDARERPSERANVAAGPAEGDAEQILRIDEADRVLEALPGIAQRQPGVAP